MAGDPAAHRRGRPVRRASPRRRSRAPRPPTRAPRRAADRAGHYREEPVNLSYVKKADEGSRYASLGTEGLVDPDPSAPPMTAEARRERLLRALEVPDEAQTRSEERR